MAAKGLIMVSRSLNARGLWTLYVLADPPCIHRKGLTCNLPLRRRSRKGCDWSAH